MSSSVVVRAFSAADRQQDSSAHKPSKRQPQQAQTIPRSDGVKHVCGDRGGEAEVLAYHGQQRPAAAGTRAWPLPAAAAAPKADPSPPSE